MKVAVALHLGPLLLGSHIRVDNVLRGHSRRIEALDVQPRLGRGRENLKQPDHARGGRPRVAEDRLVVAVHTGKVEIIGGWFERGEFECRLGKGRVEFVAAAWKFHRGQLIVVWGQRVEKGRITKASLVPARDEHQPLLGNGSLGVDGGVKRVLPVGQSQGVDLLGFYRLALGLGDGYLDVVGRFGDARAAGEAGEEVLEFGFVLLKGGLGGGGGEGAEGREGRGCC